MSEGASNTTLEQLFLSSGFGHSEARTDLGASLDMGVPDSIVVTAIAVRPQLDQVFLSPQFGRVSPATSEPDVVDLGRLRPEATVLAFTPTNAVARHRMVAAVSGVAAAALVFVGVTTGALQSHAPASGPGQQALSAGGRGSSSKGGASGGSSGSAAASGRSSALTSGTPVGTSPGAGIVMADDAAGNARVSSAVLADSTTVSRVTPPTLAPAGGTTSMPPSTPTSALSPSPVSTTPASGSSSTPTPTPTSNVVSSLVSVVAGVTSNLGNNITTTSEQLGAALPAAAPLTGLLSDVGATVNGLGNSLNSGSV
jgi:hypothetical protein